MKSFLKFIWIPILLSCLIILFIILNNKNKTSCNYFELEDVLFQINLVTNHSFTKVDYSDTLSFIPVDFDENDKFVFAVDNNQEEYFILGQNLTKMQKFDLKSYIDINNDLYSDKTIIFAEHNEYIYVISSDKYNSYIEGIIRSYIYC